MTTRRRTVALTAFAVACLVAAAIAGVVLRVARAPRGVPPEMVPADWEEFRTSVGHTLHVGQPSVTCKDCHDYERAGFKNPGVAPCARCHAKEANRFHEGGGTTKTDCLTCHVFAPARQAPTCIGCHAGVQGRLGPIVVHATTACADCHSPHGEPAVVAKACDSCHTVLSPTHAQHAGSKGCADCHEPHAPAAAAIQRCSTCHKEPAGPKPAGHDSCIGCHQPHDFKANASVCMGCHGVKDTLLASRVPAHAVCTSCHAPHSPMDAAASCATCHSSTHVAHADRTACVTCHEPHSGDTSAEARLCTSCHASVAARDTGAHAGGVSCTSCHAPHDFDPPKDRRALCARCHATEATRASANRGHTDCATCHGSATHRPTAAPACATCHAREAATAPAGHQRCAACHEPHSGDRLPQATCASCHEREEHTPHGGLTTGCQTCHRPHGPGGVAAAPACTTCHAIAKLPALHALPKHQQCADCHRSHEPPRSDRATCTGTCHADHRDHQPQAAVCTGCHVFRR